MPNLINEYKVAKLSLFFQNTIAIAGLVALTAVFPFINFDQTSPFDEIWFGVCYCGWIYGTYYFLRMPFLIRISEKKKGSIHFKGIFGKKEIPIENLLKIKVNINGTFIDFKHSDGNISVINRIQNSHDLIQRIKRINEKIKTMGC